jgi:hypothetical protein
MASNNLPLTPREPIPDSSGGVQRPSPVPLEPWAKPETYADRPIVPPNPDRSSK